MFAVKEVFLTLQGEGARAGTKAVFLRLAGCNLWSGREEDRRRDETKGACARWCDTDFVGGVKLSTAEVWKELDIAWGPSPYADARWCVITGGEPTLQLKKDAGRELIAYLHSLYWKVAIETNGTLDYDECLALGDCDHVCWSPKLGSDFRVLPAHELKVVLPGGFPGWEDDELVRLRDRYLTANPNGICFVQPQDGPNAEGMRKRAINFVMRHPEWRLSVQTHKMLNLP